MRTGVIRQTIGTELKPQELLCVYLCLFWTSHKGLNEFLGAYVVQSLLHRGGHRAERAQGRE